MPRKIAGLMIRDYENPLVSLNKAGFFRAGHFLGGGGGGGLGGVPLDCYDDNLAQREWGKCDRYTWRIIPFSKWLGSPHV